MQYFSICSPLIILPFLKIKNVDKIKNVKNVFTSVVCSSSCTQTHQQKSGIIASNFTPPVLSDVDGSGDIGTVSAHTVLRSSHWLWNAGTQNDA